MGSEKNLVFASFCGFRFLLYNEQEMKYKDTAIQYLIMLPGLILLCMGIALLAKSGLGASPISSIPLALSLITPQLTLGNYIIMVNSLLVFSQVVLLWGKPGEAVGRSGGKALPWHEVIIQILLAIITGYVVDLSLFLYRGIPLASYPSKLLAALIACWLMGTGIFIQLQANVAMAPGDAFSRAVSSVTHQSYGKVRVIADSVMVAFALTLCLVFLHKPAAVREGTVLCALLTGNIIKIDQKLASGMGRNQ